MVVYLSNVKLVALVISESRLNAAVGSSDAPKTNYFDRMAYIQILTRRLLTNEPFPISKRTMVKNSRDKSSKRIRKQFTNYFVNDKNHTFVRSSPVVPFCDPTVPFVNAGMNQFKGIFLGTKKAPWSKVANTQKCIRIGGKHNDLNLVGTDSYHHTFFEMMGNWSFGDCNKKVACMLSWELLTKVLGLHPLRFYVTYFAGDKNLGLAPDLETKDVWASLGVPKDRIFPFGVKDNFWEMGLTGPCGPCTEIHYDHFGTVNRSKFINKGLPDLIELWNIVFIQYEKMKDGSVIPLPEKHVDTGMGFERLVAIMQGKLSNYDTDIFSQIFAAISKICHTCPKYNGQYGENDWNLMDTAYRTLADHARMITVCLGDGMIPEQNQKLRKIMRRAFIISETNFKKRSGLVKELTNYVVECLGHFYPEMERNFNQIQQIVDYEESVYQTIRKEASEEWKKMSAKINLNILESPGIIKAFKELKNSRSDTITPETAYRLYDTHGLDEESIKAVAEVLGMNFNPTDFQEQILNAKMKSKLITLETLSKNTALKLRLKPTDDSLKYVYWKNSGKYVFEDVKVEIVDVFCNDEGLGDDIAKHVDCSIVLNKTNCYSEAGGQIGDRGVLKVDGKIIFEIKNTRGLNGCVLHDGKLRTTLKTGQKAVLSVDRRARLDTMRHHTGVHLLNAALKKLKNATCQKSSRVTDKCLNLDVAIYGSKLSGNEIQTLENYVNKIIKDGVEVKTEEVNSEDVFKLSDVTLIPGEIYPETGIRLVEIVGKEDFVSREPCCGTHVINTADLEDFCIVGMKSLGRSTVALYAVAGDRAKLARKNSAQLLDEVVKLQKKVDDNIDKPEVLEVAVNSLREKLNYDVNGPNVISVVTKNECSGYLNCIEKQLKQIAKGTLKEFIEIEMQNVLQNNKARTPQNQEYVIHYLRCSMMLENVPLQRATKLCPDLPILVIAYSDSVVKARCCVPEKLKSADFNAEKWLSSSVASIFGSSAAAPKGQDSTLICNMKAKRISLQEWDTLLNESLKAAKSYIERYL